MDFTNIIDAYFGGTKDPLRKKGFTEDEIELVYNDEEYYSELRDKSLLDVSQMLLEDTLDNMAKRDIAVPN